MNIVIIIVAVVAALLGGLFGFAATKPNSFRIQRTTRINAPPQKIFPMINDFHHWTAWSPWEQLDPNLKRKYSGAASGPGAVYDWSGNGKAGTGRMEIKDVATGRKVVIQLDFIKPIKAQNTAEFTLSPQGATTEVTWAMYGPSRFMSKVISVFMNMDKLVGKDFEKGLAALKVEAEK